MCMIMRCDMGLQHGIWNMRLRYVIVICDCDMGYQYMPLDVRGLIGRRTGNRNIVSTKDKGFWSLHIYAICDNAMMRL